MRKKLPSSLLFSDSEFLTALVAIEFDHIPKTKATVAARITGVSNPRFRDVWNYVQIQHDAVGIIWAADGKHHVQITWKKVKISRIGVGRAQMRGAVMEAFEMSITTKKHEKIIDR